MHMHMAKHPASRLTPRQSCSRSTCTPVIAPTQMLDNNSSVAELKQAEEKMCDGALTAFRRAVREISRSAKLQAYNKNEEILKYFDGDYQTVSLTLAHRLGRCMHASLRARGCSPA